MDWIRPPLGCPVSLGLCASARWAPLGDSFLQKRRHGVTHTRIWQTWLQKALLEEDLSFSSLPFCKVSKFFLFLLFFLFWLLGLGFKRVRSWGFKRVRSWVQWYVANLYHLKVCDISKCCFQFVFEIKNQSINLQIENWIPLYCI